MWGYIPVCFAIPSDSPPAYMLVRVPGSKVKLGDLPVGVVVMPLWTETVKVGIKGSATFRPVLADERTQIRSDPVPGLSVDTLGAFRVGKPVTRSESGFVRSG
jgi:hypothetical protein